MGEWGEQRIGAGDALALVVCRQRGFTPQQFARVHPGGSLGRRLQAVSELMRQGEQLRIALADMRAALPDGVAR